MEISKEKLFRIFIKSCPKELSESFIIIDPENTFQWLMLFNCFSATSGCINLPSSTRISSVCRLYLNISLSFSWISASSSPVLVWLSGNKNQGVNFRGETLLMTIMTTSKEEVKAIWNRHLTFCMESSSNNCAPNAKIF